MSTIGRNDPCPCGSGKKYKKCCGQAVADAPELIYDCIRRLDGESSNLLVRYAQQEFGPDSLEEAWEDFCFSDGRPFDDADPEFEYFTRWFTFYWRPLEEETLAESFLAQRGKKLDDPLRRFIETTLSAPYSFFQALEVTPGVGMRVRDILRKQEFTVVERTASTILERGHILFACLVEMDGICFFMGNGTQIILPTFLNSLLDVRAGLEEEELLNDGVVTATTLLAAEEDLRELYFEIVDEMKNSTIDIRNTDGDPLALYTLTYSIPSLERGFHALKDLELKLTRQTDEELLAQAERNETGTPTKVYIHWLKQSKKNNILKTITLATFTVSDSTLSVEVNSEKRSKRVQKEIMKRLGDDAVLLKTEIMTRDAIMNAAHEKKDDDKSETEHDRIMREVPEARAFMKESMERHWAAWPDSPLPALRGMTPRRAAHDPLGRELLESLLMDFELRNHNQKDEFLRVDIARLRRELGMDGG